MSFKFSTASVFRVRSSSSRRLIRPLQLLCLASTSNYRVSLLVHGWSSCASTLCRPRTNHASIIISRRTFVRAFSSSSLLSSSSEEEGPSQEDQNRWDQLYQEGEARRNRLEAMMNPSSDIGSGTILDAQLAPAPVRVVTFDLDNTLWNTGATISAANNALAAFLTQHDISQSKRTETIMGDLFKANKAKYCPLATTPDQLDAAKAPVLLTQLRKDALQQILVQDNGYNSQDAKEFADEAFQVWMDARYEAIPSHYATNVVAVLERLSHMRYTNNNNNNNNNHPILMGAITDGNSDPRNVPALAPFFDFCVNAEQVGVAKPDKRVYQMAMELVRQRLGMGNDNVEDWVGPWWIHVGDDFAKDIVAAKNLNLRTVWARELILDKLRKEQEGSKQEQQQETIAAQYNNNNGNNDNPSSPEQELMDFQKKINSQPVVKMAVGARDYLSETIQREFADAMIDNFAELATVLQKWQEQSLSSSSSAQQSALPFVPDEADLVRDMIREKRQSTSASSATPPQLGETAGETATTTTTNEDEPFVPDEADLVSASASSSSPQLETKFCMFCGTKIPAVAIHCPACGNKQPEMAA